jgi:hypothetical protein
MRLRIDSSSASGVGPMVQKTVSVAGFTMFQGMLYQLSS